MKIPSATRPAWGADLSALIYAEQISMLYRQLPTSVAGNMVGALLLSGFLLDQQPRTLIGGWLACVTALQASRLLLYLRAKKTAFVQRRVRRAALVWAGGAGVSGALWGTTALIFFTPGEPVYQAVLTVVVLGITASAVPLIGSHRPSFYVFVLPALIPYIARNAYEADVPHFVLSFTLFAVMLGLMSFARNYNRMLTESLRNRFEKQALAERLALQNVDLERARVDAEQANRSKTQFFTAASHDLRQPLHAMGMFASALTEKVSDPEVASVVGSINASVKALEALFNELLDISKLDSGIIKPKLAHFALDEVCDRLRSEFTAEAAAKNLRLHFGSSGQIVFSDASLLERIIRNLVSNAIRYTSAGEIAVTATVAGAALRIDVRDTGIGIRDQDQQRIFEEFCQLGNPGRTSRKGMGLGLSIVQRLCGLLGYSIRLASEYGTGSTFSFEVPLGSVALQRRVDSERAGAKPADLTGKLVVVVDDEGAILEGMKVLLEGWGAEVICSTTGDDVVAAVYEVGRAPDLLIVDYRLGDGDNGLRIAQRIRHELDPELPALLVTGSITPDLAGQAQAAGLGFLLKPVMAFELREHISAVLSRDVPVRAERATLASSP